MKSLGVYLLEYVKSTELEVAKVGKKRVLRLGITPTTVATIMPCVSLFSRRNPDVNFEVHDGITYTLYRYLMDGIIDISIARTPLRLDDVDYKILSSEPMIAVSSKDMLPEKNGSLKLSDLLNIPLIIYRRYEALIMDAFHSRGMEPDLFCVCDDPRGAMLWAKEGLATAIFPQSMSSLCSSSVDFTYSSRLAERSYSSFPASVRRTPWRVRSNKVTFSSASSCFN